MPRVRDLAAHDRRPPEHYRRLGETFVGDNLLRQPLNAGVRTRRHFVAESRSPNFAVPGVALLVDVVLVHHCHRHLGEPVLPILLMPVRPRDNLDAVFPGALDLDIDQDRAVQIAVPYRNVVIGSAVRVVPRTPTSPSVDVRRVQVLELAADDHHCASIADIQSIQIDRSVDAGVSIVEIIRVEHSQGIGAGHQRCRP